ncbi:hypothetical protein KIN20_001133 [Parelaphostrongylus tenuis]|uniref:Uncharacterized protein n=1 Tax=Parelaphostrongylus tenuis TaxID=148309 RepID=A0AAD5LT80_PARTN|nr:hypothetical protein KIN20_001133 [Parelaphostrongylus tenuis]
MLRELVDQLLRRRARSAAVHDSNTRTSTVMTRFSDEPPILVTIATSREELRTQSKPMVSDFWLPIVQTT